VSLRTGMRERTRAG